MASSGKVKNGERKRSENRFLSFRILSYPRSLLTAETSTRIAAAVRPMRIRTENFRPQCATISTEIGEGFCCVIADSPLEKQKSPSAATVGLFALWALSHDSVIAGHARKFSIRLTVRKEPARARKPAILRGSILAGLHPLPIPIAECKQIWPEIASRHMGRLHSRRSAPPERRGSERKRMQRQAMRFPKTSASPGGK